MEFPSELRYTKDHEWVRLEGNTAYVGITSFAQSELGDIVYVEVDTVGQSVAQEEVFGTIEAVKTVSDLFMPLAGKILELNDTLESNPEIVNESPYTEGWIIKVAVKNTADYDTLLSAEEYKELIGK